MNIEHAYDLSTLRQNDEDENGPELSLKEQLLGIKDSDETKASIADQAVEQAEKHIKKHQKEIDRLNAHAEKCLFEDNYEGYHYAVNKLRVIYKQDELTKEVSKQLYTFTRNELIKLIEKAKLEV